MKKLYLTFICVVLAALLIPSVLMFCGFKNANRENRVLAKLPKLISEEGFNTKFASQFDRYVDDNFALREYLVTGFNKLDIALLRDINGDNAVIGRGDQIFYGDTVDDYLGIDQLTPERIRSIANYLADLSAQFEKKGVRFAFMTAPNKATIYPELMPSYLKSTDSARNIDMLNKELDTLGVKHIDAKSILLEAKENRTVYYEHDSHWNNYGAMLVYNAIAELFGLEEYDAENYTAKTDRTGDLHNFVYPVGDHLEERIIYPSFHEYSSKRPVNIDRDKLVETSSDVNGVTMAFYHDSFGRSLQPILSQSVGRLCMNSYFPYDLEYLEDIEPDIVLIELVERNLDLLCLHAESLGY